MTVRENVAFGLEVRKRPKAEIPRARRRAARARAAPDFGDRYPAQLSGGQRQRMGLARALAPSPGAAARRAVRRARRPGPGRAARVAAPAARPGARHDRLRHARPAGGDGGLRPDRHPEPRATWSRSGAAGALRRACVASSSSSSSATRIRSATASSTPARPRPARRAATGAVEAMVDRVTMLGRDVQGGAARHRRLGSLDADDARPGWTKSAAVRRGQQVWLPRPKREHLLRLAPALEQRDEALADTDAERGGGADHPAPAEKLVEQRYDEAGAAHPERVTRARSRRRSR